MLDILLPAEEIIESLEPAATKHATHRHFMERALHLAARGEGKTSPNPMVGAVVVREGVVVGEGYHRRAGEAHAEVEALAQAGDAAQGATLYVTLEPCNHYGRTPPCTEAILRAGIRTVYYAIEDPNPRVSGSGHRRLQKAGIRVYMGPCTQEARFLNRFFFHHITTRRPYVVAKFAASIDGKIATRTGESQWITGNAARQRGHYLRQACDAIVTGVNTVIADNPSLTTRISHLDSAMHPPYDHPSHPLRIVMDSTGRVPLSARIFSRELPGQTLVATTSAMTAETRAGFAANQIDVLTLAASADGKIDLSHLLTELGTHQVMSLLVEGGGELLAAFIDAGLVDEVWAFIAPIVIGGETAPGAVRGLGAATLAQALHLANCQVELLEGDILVRGQTNQKPLQGIETEPADTSQAGNCVCSPAL